MQSVSPIFVSAEVDIDPASSGPPNNEALKNPTDGPIEIHEIRFQMGMAPVTQSFSGNLFSNFICGGLVGVDLSVGNLPITNGTTPIWNFGKKVNPWSENVGTSANVTKFINFSWKLKQPLYLPPKRGLIANFTNFGSGPGVTTISTRVSYSAKQCAKRTGETLIPWAGPWRSKGIDMATAGTDKSQEINLKPPVSKPFSVERFTARALVNPSVALYSLVSSVLYEVKLYDSLGRALIRDFTPFDLAFSQATSSWELNELKMPGDAYFTAFLKKAATDAGSDSGEGNVTSVNMAAVGYYSADIKEI